MGVGALLSPFFFIDEEAKSAKFHTAYSHLDNK